MDSRRSPGDLKVVLPVGNSPVGLIKQTRFWMKGVLFGNCFLEFPAGVKMEHMESIRSMRNSLSQPNDYALEPLVKPPFAQVFSFDLNNSARSQSNSLCRQRWKFGTTFNANSFPC